MKIATALGGFGGFNLHGAGILAAIRRLKVEPDLFTVTSGQIVVLSEWLQGRNPRDLLLGAGSQTGPVQTLATAMTGHPGVFRPATTENLKRWLDFPFTATGFMERMMPARRYVPILPPARFEEVAATLNGAPMGVVFNTYDFAAGKGVLHGNAPARKLMPSDVELRPITADAVESALWLYLYGFEEAPNGLIDGAYHRSLILGELHGFDRVIVGCPFPTAWEGPPPANSLEVEDWKVKQWFSNSYRAEVDRLRKAIALIEKGSLQDPEYRIRDLVEIPRQSRWGYFDYFSEKEEVFQDALVDALTVLAPFAHRRSVTAG
ncbi:MAG TPA: hypothetical protein VD978_23830 [Azospirillum sp.]|nr:hypothetical protein [Azospirillum sp.]